MTLHLFETSEEDSFGVVAQHIGNLLNEGQARTALAETPGSRFVEDCLNLLQEDRIGEYIDRIVPHIDLLYSKSSEKDVESSVSILVHSLQRIGDDVGLRKAALTLASAIAAGDDKLEERLSGLTHLVAIISYNSEVQYELLKTTLTFGRRNAKLAALLVPTLRGRAETLSKQLELNSVLARELYLSLAGLMKLTSDKASAKEYLKLVTYAFGLVKADDKKLMSAMVPEVASALVHVIRTPSLLSVDFSDLPCVQQLKDIKEHSSLLALFNALMNGDLKDFRAAVNPAVIEVVGLSAEALLQKAQQMALLGLCSRATRGEVTFDQIQAALDIPREQVETWVVKAVGNRSLECKIDQVREVVTVARATHRTFGISEWKELRTQLFSWRESLASVGQLVGTLRPPAPIAAYRASVGAAPIRA